MPTVDRDVHLAARATFGADPTTVLEIRETGADAWIDRQLSPDSIDDSAAETMVQNAVLPYAATAADIRMLVRARWSKRQLQWRMVHFLNNHFATYRGSTQGISETKEDDAFASACFGDFASLLRISATSPAMIDFLDSRSNVAGNPNENYARELMELHTIGVNGGYNEPDVAEVARVFTGWSRINVNNGTGTPVTDSYFVFRSNNHDTGNKSTSLGWSTPGIAGAQGYREGYSLLDFLAAHPATAVRFTTKLCQYFVADQPTAALLARVHQAFVSSNGDLGQTLRALFYDPDFYDPSHLRAKVHDGFEYVVNILRRLDVSTIRYSTVNTRVGTLGAQPHQNPVPTGYPEVGPQWQGAGHVLPRWDFADDLAHNRIFQTAIDWSVLFPVLPQNGAGWVEPLVARLLDGQVQPMTYAALVVFMDHRLAALPPNPTSTQLRPHVRALTSLILRLPEAQLH